MKKLLRHTLLCYIILVFSLIIVKNNVFAKNTQTGINGLCEILSGTGLINFEFNNYRPLHSEQLKNFLKQKEFNPLAVRNIGNYTIILFEIDNLTGSYILSSDESGNISENKVVSNNSLQINPVLIATSSSIGSEGSISFIQVIINDNKLLKESEYIKIVFRNKNEVTEIINNKKGLIIPYQTQDNLISTLTIYDKNQKEIYKKRM